MSCENSDQYRQLFIEEAKEHIDTITNSMLILEKDPKNQDVVNMLFRSAHTLKGSSGMMGFKDFQQLTHAMEDIFDGMRRRNKPSCSLVSLLLECVDALSQKLECIKNHVNDEIAVSELTEKLKVSCQPALPNLLKEKSTTQNTVHTRPKFDDVERELIKQAQDIGQNCYLIDLEYSDDCSMKTVRANMLLKKISDLADVIKTLPEFEEFSEESCRRFQ